MTLLFSQCFSFLYFSSTTYSTFIVLSVKSREEERTWHQIDLKMEGYRKNDSHFATKALHVGQEPEQWTSMSVVPPISLATTFKQDGPADFRQ